MQLFPSVVASLLLLVALSPGFASAQGTGGRFTAGGIDRPKVDPKFNTAQMARPKAGAKYTATTWQQVWDESWDVAHRYYFFNVASSLTADPACRGDLQLHDTVRQVIGSVAAKRYGDALRHTGTFQDRILCLPREGARGVEFALATFLHRAVNRLPPDQARIAVQGVLNLGMLSFDQLQYTKSSWWLPAVGQNHARIAPHLRDYPAELGLLMYDFNRAALAQAPGMERLVDAMQRVSPFGEGTCTLLEMSRAEFNCAAAGGGGKAGSGGKQGVTDGAGGMGLPSGGAIACTIDAGRAAGSRGMLACMQKATAGMTFDPRTSPQGLLSPQPGLRDPRCALSQDAGGGKEGGKEGGQQPAPKQEPPLWQKVAGAVWEAAKALFDKTPDPTPSADFASKEGAEAAGNALGGLQQNSAKQMLLSDQEGAYEAYQKEKEAIPPPKDFEGRQGPDVGGPLGGSGGGSCSNASNAAKRAQAMYQCTGGDKVKPGKGPGIPGQPGGGNNPVALTSETSYTPTGAMACLMQGGDMMRTSFNDPKCAAMRCAEGAPCPCNKGGAGNQLPGTGIATNPNDMTPVINCGGGASSLSLKGKGGSAGDPCGTMGGGGGGGGGITGGGGGPQPGGPVPLGGGGGTPKAPSRIQGASPPGAAGSAVQQFKAGTSGPLPGGKPGAFDELERETRPR